MADSRKIFLMEQTYATLFSLTNKIQVQGDKCFGTVTSRQFMAMVAIIHLPKNGATLNNIARKLGTTKQSVKQVIDILENKGYVITVPSKQDRRAVNVVITEAGKQAMVDCNTRGIRFLENMFGGFTAEELETLWSALKKLYRFDGEAMDGFEEEAPFDQI